jgi:hypothetical protein
VQPGILPVTRRRAAVLFFVANVTTLGSCIERETSAEPSRALSPPPPASPQILAALRGRIDLTTGVLEFENAAAELPAAAIGVSRAVYGDQNVLVKLYNTPVSIDSTSVPGTKTWTGNVGLQNLTTHVIGDEQAGAAPDTMGVFVFFNTTPTVTAPSPCPGCSVTINRYDGTGNFTAPGQLYFWWRDRVAANDTTKARLLWSFSAPAQVTGFSFTVLVSAAWPPPAEARWKVTLNNDSLPDTQEEPRWHIEQSGSSNTYTASGGSLTINASSNGALRFYRRDSVAATGSGYIEARMQSSSANQNRPEARIAIDDGDKYVGLGIARGTVWFVDTSATFLAGTPVSVNTTAGYNTYQLRKYGADSAAFFVNGTWRGAILYALLPAGSLVTGPRFIFGNRGIVGASGGSWDYVLYEIGTPFP